MTGQSLVVLGGACAGPALIGLSLLLRRRAGGERAHPAAFSAVAQSSPRAAMRFPAGPDAAPDGPAPATLAVPETAESQTSQQPAVVAEITPLGRAMVGVQVLGLLGALAYGVLAAGRAHWDLPLLAMLAACAVLSDLTAFHSHSSRLKVSGSFLALVLAMVLLGGSPAALLGIACIGVGWLRWREAPHWLLQNLLVYAWFPLIGGVAFSLLQATWHVGTGGWAYYALIFAVFALALALNFLGVGGYVCLVERTSLRAKVREALLPVLSSELFSALLAVAVAYLYRLVGLGALALFTIVLVFVQNLLGKLVVSERRAQDLERRTDQLASLHVGMLSSLLHGLDLRDRMTARHSAAVARYAREIAREAGFSEAEQDLVHTAGLLHDIGKFIFPDDVLKADRSPTAEEWEIIRAHPGEGARLVRQVEGYGPVADIIEAHHERIDGRGYPRQLGGEEIPALSRIVSVADVYDVMTARDSYRTPISSLEAIQELFRVADSQLATEYVRILVSLLAGKSMAYRHGEDADFDAELARERSTHLFTGAAERAGATAALKAEAS